jgi:hypothetical protein
MPVRRCLNDDRALVERYEPPMRPGSYGFDDGALLVVKGIRRAATTSQQELASILKTIRDREDARFLKGEIKRFGRQQKAAHLWVEWFETLGDKRFHTWPIELSEELDYVINAYDLARC